MYTYTLRSILDSVLDYHSSDRSSNHHSGLKLWLYAHLLYQCLLFWYNFNCKSYALNMYVRVLYCVLFFNNLFIFTSLIDMINGCILSYYISNLQNYAKEINFLFLIYRFLCLCMLAPYSCRDIVFGITVYDSMALSIKSKTTKRNNSNQAFNS